MVEVEERGRGRREKAEKKEGYTHRGAGGGKEKGIPEFLYTKRNPRKLSFI